MPHSRGELPLQSSGLGDQLDGAAVAGAELVLEDHVEEAEALELAGPAQRPGVAPVDLKLRPNPALRAEPRP